MANLLIVEPNIRRAEAIQLMLDFAMHETVIVPNGQEALAYLRRYSLPEAIIANVIMAEMDGFHLCRSIKLERELAHLPVLLLTESYSLAGDENLARRAGAAALLRRPLDRENFLSEVDRAILMASVQNNPLTKQNPVEELSFLRDYNTWLSGMAHQAIQQREVIANERDLQEAHIHAIDMVTTALGENLDLRETTEKLVNKTAELLRAQAVAVYIYTQEDLFTLGNVTGFGIPTPTLLENYHLHKDTPLEALRERNRALLFNDSAALQSDLGLHIKLTSIIASPLVAGQVLSGFLLAFRVGGNDLFTNQDAETLFSLSGAAGLALRSAILFNEVETAYEELQDMDRRKSEFVAITSHELRTPLAIMLGYASLLLDAEKDPRKKAQLSTIEKQASFLSGMVDALLNLHELNDEDEPVRVRCQPLRVDEILYDALEVTMTHGMYNKEIQFDIDCDPIEIIGDDVRLMLAMHNLMDNAIKFSESGTRASVVVAERPEGGVVITVEDQGIGIDEAQFERIFEPFYQVEPAITRHHGGMGLGLAIVKGMIDLHGGKIEIKSKLGVGTRVIVTLPSRPPEERCKKF